MSIDDRLEFKFELKNCLARVQSTPIFREHSKASEESAMRAVQMQHGGSRHWLNGPKMYEYIRRNRFDIKGTDIVTLYVPNLRAVYRNLGVDVQKFAQEVIHPLPNWKNVYNYGSLGSSVMEQQKNLYEYQLDGYITPFDVLHFTAGEFVEFFNQESALGKYIAVLKDGRSVVIILRWFGDDMWSNEFQDIIIKERFKFHLQR
jgi:hypothetical protein